MGSSKFSANTAPTPSTSKIKVGDASGTDDAMAMPIGKFNPEIRAVLTVAPEVVYSPMVLPASFVTNRFPPETAIANGAFNPEIKAVLTVAPEVVYSPIVSLPCVTNRFPPDNAMPPHHLSPKLRRR